MVKTRFRGLWLLLIILPAAVASGAELQRHTVDADGHPIAVWEKRAADATEAVLLVHGRTWSALPDFDLQVEGRVVVADGRPR